MAASIISFRKFDLSGSGLRKADALVSRLLKAQCLETEMSINPGAARDIDNAVETSLYFAFKEDTALSDAALLFLHRTLYRLNRLNYFWVGDSLANYNNERSLFMNDLKNRIEDEWLSWELGQIDIHRVKTFDAKKTLQEWAAHDFDPQLDENSAYIRKNITMAGYLRIIQTESMSQLVKVNQLSRNLAGVGDKIGLRLNQIYQKENRNLLRMPRMLKRLNLDPHPEAYVESMPWQPLANLNLIFLHSERKRFYLRYLAGLTYIKCADRNQFQTYHIAAQRLQLSEEFCNFWKSAATNSEKHSQLVLERAAIPALQAYPDHGLELLLGYELHKRVNERSNEAMFDEIRIADQISSR